MVVAEGSPKCQGILLARRLAEAGITTTVITGETRCANCVPPRPASSAPPHACPPCSPDAAVFAMMARVDKVLVSPHAILANGGVISGVGMHAVALAARHHAVPFVCLGGLYKLSPLFPHQPEVAFNEFASPAAICSIDTLALPLR